MNRAYYSDTIARFLDKPPDEILGRLTRGAGADGWAVETDQNNAWREQIDLLKTILAALPE